jgi:hypothetical protein
MALNGPPKASDVSGWEKSFTDEMAEDHGSLMRKTCANDSPTLVKALDWWAMSLTTTPYVTDEGELIDFRDKRVQRSGDLMTTAANGSQRAARALAIGSIPKDMGDDCLEWTKLTKEELIEAYSKIGLPVRDVEDQELDTFLFCSHRFKRRSDGSWTSWLETWERMIFESAHSKLNDESTNLNYRDEVANMPDCFDRRRILHFLDRRQEMLSAVAGHEQEQEEGSDPDEQASFGCSGDRSNAQRKGQAEEKGKSQAFSRLGRCGALSPCVDQSFFRGSSRCASP